MWAVLLSGVVLPVQQCCAWSAEKDRKLAESNWRLKEVSWHAHRSEVDDFCEAVCQGKVGDASFWRLLLAVMPPADLFCWQEGSAGGQAVKERVFGWKDRRMAFRWDPEANHWECVGPRDTLPGGCRVVAVLSSGEFGHSKRHERRLVVLFGDKWVATEWSERLPPSARKEVEHSPVEGGHCLTVESEALEEKSVQRWYSAVQQDREAAAEDARS